MRLPAFPPMETRGWLALASVLQVMGGMLLLALVQIPDKNRDLFNILLAQAVVVGFVAVFGYYFGTSKGAADVRAQLGQVIDKLPDPKD